MKMETVNRSKHIEHLKTAATSYSRPKRNPIPFVIHMTRLGFRLLGPLFPNYAGKLAYQLFTTPQNRARHKTSDRILEQAKMFEFLYGGKVLKGYEWGSGDKTCLLVHGWESRGTALRSFVPSLVENGYRVVAFDGPAHGNSDGTQTNLPHFAGAIRAAIQHIGDVDSIIAHSFGGASTVFALANVDNTIHLEKLVMVATPSRMEKALDHFSTFLTIPKTVQKKFRETLEKRAKVLLNETSVTLAYPKVNIKQTMVIHDKKDEVVPFAAAEAIYQTWNNITFLVTEGLGHFHLMKNPDLINRVIQFIKTDE